MEVKKMPELPEVETVKETLKKLILKKNIAINKMFFMFFYLK